MQKFIFAIPTYRTFDDVVYGSNKYFVFLLNPPYLVDLRHELRVKKITKNGSI